MRRQFNQEKCAIARSLNVIGDRWTLLIIRDALAGVTRFSEFQRSLGVAKNILSARLKALLAGQLLELRIASDGSAYQEYVLTTKGRALVPALVALSQWSREHVVASDEVVLTPVDRKARQPICTIELKAEDGQTLRLEDVRFYSGYGVKRP